MKAVYFVDDMRTLSLDFSLKKPKILKSPTQMRADVYTVSLKQFTLSAFYNFDIHKPILIIFCRNFTEKVSNQKVFYFHTLLN